MRVTPSKTLTHPLSQRAMGPSKAPAWVLRKGLRPSRIPPGHPSQPKESFMNWSQPAFEDIRFGFEITMYISNR